MKALILRQDAEAACAVSRALVDKGFQILCVEKLDVAHALIRVDTIDLLVMDERIGGQLTHAIALSGERKNPYLSAIFLTDRTSSETDDLYSLIPSLYAIVGMGVGADVIAKLAMSAISNVEDVMARVARQHAEDAAETAPLLLEDIVPANGADNDALIDVDAFAEDVADVAIAAPAMAEIRTVRPPRPPASRPLSSMEKIEDVILAEVAAIFRNDGFEVPDAGARAPRQADQFEVVGEAV